VEELSIPIVQQPRLVLVLPVGFIIGAVVAANIAWYLVRAVGGPRWLGGVCAVAFLLAGIAGAVASSVGAQGTVRADDGTRLTVNARWHASRHVSLAAGRVRRYVWRRGRPPLVVGVYVVVEAPDGRVSIGAADPGLVPEFQESGAETTTIPPSVLVGQADFRQLLQRLPTRAAGGGR